MTWLVTGGAGYIGSHVVRAFLEAGTPVVVIDSLTSGRDSFVPKDVPFVRGTILDGDLRAACPRRHDVTGVVHLAGFKYAGVSVDKPAANLPAERHRHRGAAGGRWRRPA